MLDLLAAVLGGGDSSVLWQEIREKTGLVHSIDASSWNPGTSGLFCIGFTADPAKRLSATRAIAATLARCAVKGFTPAHLRKAMRQVVVGEINTRKTMSGQASRLGAAEVVVGDIDYSRAYFERLRAVRPADLQRVLKTYLQAARLTSISLNPIESAAPAIAAAPALAARPDFSEITLSNGARLLLQPDAHLPNLHLRLAVTGGPLFEVAGQRGATALLATLLTKDAGQRTAARQ